MMTITIQAVYRDGVLKPERELDLPENTPVQVQVTPLPTTTLQGNSLFGAFPELSLLTEDDFDWAKRLWEHSAEKQSRILDGLE
jgi:predicted DNA-binding antitoxin AbrB/MazE fold protein